MTFSIDSRLFLFMDVSLTICHYFILLTLTLYILFIADVQFEMTSRSTRYISYKDDRGQLHMEINEVKKISVIIH